MINFPVTILSCFFVNDEVYVVYSYSEPQHETRCTVSDVVCEITRVPFRLLQVTA